MAPHWEKASMPISVTVPGIFTAARAEQPAKARSPMEVRPLGRTTSVRLPHSLKADAPTPVTAALPIFAGIAAFVTVSSQSVTVPVEGSK